MGRSERSSVVRHRAQKNAYTMYGSAECSRPPLDNFEPFFSPLTFRFLSCPAWRVLEPSLTSLCHGGSVDAADLPARPAAPDDMCNAAPTGRQGLLKAFSSVHFHALSFGCKIPECCFSSACPNILGGGDARWPGCEGVARLRLVVLVSNSPAQARFGLCSSPSGLCAGLGFV